jgi:crotonobetainyl-CoA:carnitine CoA-transferase CaiB-like acyl-CoA transferase
MHAHACTHARVNEQVARADEAEVWAENRAAEQRAVQGAAGVWTSRGKPASRYLGGNPAVQWLVGSLVTLAAFAAVLLLVHRRLGGGQEYFSMSTRSGGGRAARGV